MGDNIVLIVVDCLRRDSADDRQLMPFLNSLKAETEWQVAERSFTNAATTFFAMPTMMTGVLPFTRTNKAGIQPEHAGAFLPQKFKQRGYRTTGITGNVMTSRAFGYADGFDEFEDFLLEKIQRPAANGDCGNKDLDWDLDSKVYGELILERLKRVNLNSQGNFVFLHFMEPHAPYYPTDREIDRVKLGKATEKLYKSPETLEADEVAFLKGLYDLEVYSMDRLLKATIDHLKSTLDWKNTKVIITADHGEAFGENGYFEHESAHVSDRNHRQTPFLVKGYELEDRDYWTADLYDLILGEDANRGFYQYMVGYRPHDKTVKPMLRTYYPCGVFCPTRGQCVESEDELELPN